MPEATAVETDDDRWARAQARLEQLPRPEGRRGGPLRVTGRLTVIALALLVLSAVLVLLPALPPGPGLLDHHVSPWRGRSGAALSLLGALVELTGAVLSIVSTAWTGSSGTAPEAALTGSQRRQLRRQAAGQAPVDVRHVPLARHVAAQARDAQAGHLFGLGASLVVSGQCLQHPSVWDLLITCVAALVYPLALVRQQRVSRRAAAFLRTHPLPSSAGR